MTAKSKIIYFPGLNGIRAIAASAVVISHTTLALSSFNLDPYIFGRNLSGGPKGLSLAGFGVSIFFVLSGFLITYLLQVEKEVKPISIKKFYLRRILRIWPLYYLYLLLVVSTIAYFGLEFNINSLLLYIFYAANVPFALGTALPFLHHYWSLGVEEQFYMFWPWLVKKVQRLELTIFLLIIFLVLLKFAVHFVYPSSFMDTFLHVTRFQCMMMGALGAIWYKRNFKLFMTIANNKVTQVICWAVLFLVAINNFHIATVIDNELISVAAMALIIGQIEIKNRLINLERNVLDFLGKISYGMYVIHPLLIFFLSKILSDLEIDPAIKYPLVFVSVFGTTVLLAYISYNHFEKYFLKFKSRFVVVKSSPSRNINIHK